VLKNKYLDSAGRLQTLLTLEALKNAMANPQHEILNVPTSILVGFTAAVLYSFFVLTYLMMLVMDELRS
jgi:hypothetical protein